MTHPTPMEPDDYAAMMKSALAHVKDAHDRGGDMNAALRQWQAANMRLSKAEQAIVRNRVVPRIINRKRDRKAA